jgi:hypothetical protein
VAKVEFLVSGSSVWKNRFNTFLLELETRTRNYFFRHASRRVSQFCLIYGLTAVLCGSTWKAVLSADLCVMALLDNWVLKYARGGV